MFDPISVQKDKFKNLVQYYYTKKSAPMFEIPSVFKYYTNHKHVIVIRKPCYRTKLSYQLQKKTFVYSKRGIDGLAIIPVAWKISNENVLIYSQATSRYYRHDDLEFNNTDNLLNSFDKEFGSVLRDLNIISEYKYRVPKVVLLATTLILNEIKECIKVVDKLRPSLKGLTNQRIKDKQDKKYDYIVIDSIIDYEMKRAVEIADRLVVLKTNFFEELKPYGYAFKLQYKETGEPYVADM